MSDKVPPKHKRAVLPSKPKAAKIKKSPPGSPANTTGQARQAASKSTVRPGSNGRNAPVCTPEELKARIASRAYELYQSRGGHHGSDLDDWLEAETLVSLEQQVSRH